MRKSINFFFILLLSIASNYSWANQIKVTWTGIAGVLLDDGEHVIGIDNTFTKPSLSHWLFNKEFTADEKLLKQKIEFYSIKKLHALFVSHTHFDHAVDIAPLAAIFQSTIYGSDSLQNLAQSYGKKFNLNLKIEQLKNQESITIGKFKITAFNKTHEPILKLLDWHFLPGQIRPGTSLNFYDYYDGDSWSYLIEHVDGNFFFDQGGVPNLEIIQQLPPIHTALLGVTNKKSVANWIEGYAHTLKPKKILPLHHEWFLLDFPKVPFTLWNTNLSEIQQELNKLNIEFLLN